MNKKLKFTTLVIALSLMLCILCFPLVGCGVDEDSLKDGYYTAVQDGYEHGWQEYVTIEVKNGKILTVDFQAVTPSGFVKSWDLDYMRIMNMTDGTYPNEYVRILTQEFIKDQQADVDMVTGATNSSNRFRILAAAAIEQAQKGDTSVKLVPDEETPEN
jgi:major membrane immunogen (membrane-anchored lipoprotein)